MINIHGFMLNGNIIYPVFLVVVPPPHGLCDEAPACRSAPILRPFGPQGSFKDAERCCVGWF